MERNRSPHKAISIVRSQGHFVKQKLHQKRSSKLVPYKRCTLLILDVINATIRNVVILSPTMSKKLKAAELFLSLGLAATLVTGCGAPEGGEAVEEDTGVEEVQPETTEMPESESDEGGEGGEGGEG